METRQDCDLRGVWCTYSLVLPVSETETSWPYVARHSDPEQGRTR